MASSSPLLCRLGVHAYDKNRRDVEGRFWCHRCGRQGTDDYVDPDQMPPAQGGL